ncbi:MAG: LptF/LptG family permease [Leptospirales bacterium]
MRILTRYIAGELSKIFLLCLVSLEAIYGVIDSVEKIKDFLSHHASLTLMGEYFFYRGIEVSFRVLPMAGLLATLLTLGILSKNQELTAIRAAGISLVRATKPFLVLGLLISFLELGLNYQTIPYAYQMTDYIKDVRIDAGRNGTPSFELNNVWFRHGSHDIYGVRLIQNGGKTLNDVVMYHLDDRFHLRWQIRSHLLEYQNARWEFRGGQKILFRPNGSLLVTHFGTLISDLRRRPVDFTFEQTRITHLSYPELRRYIMLLRNSRLPTQKFEVTADAMVAFPMASFLMILMAIPFGIREGRQVGIAKGFGISLMLSMSYWTIYSLGLALGEGGVLSPWISAWFANMIVFSVSMALFLLLNRS